MGDDQTECEGDEEECFLGSLHSKLAKVLSSLSLILANPCLLLVQVRDGPLNPRSMRKHSKIILFCYSSSA